MSGRSQSPRGGKGFKGGRQGKKNASAAASAKSSSKSSKASVTASTSRKDNGHRKGGKQVDSNNVSRKETAEDRKRELRNVIIGIKWEIQFFSH